MKCKNKSCMTKKRAFTLIELLIVIAIIGILFIVLVSKVDFATDKAKAAGVQTDFRSFQMALDTVAKENAGFNTFGWDTGDANQDGIRNSYDEGDANKDGIQNGTEVFTGHKVYAETFTKVYSLKKAKSDGTLETNYDRDALNRLESASNANLGHKLHITIKDDGEIVMANGAQDPWNKEYHGWYITNAEVDKKDRGAIVMYSDGANNEFGSEHTIANGIVKVIVPGLNKAGKDDYVMSVIYTYSNGYGETKTITNGFSNNQTFLEGNGNVSNNVVPGGENNNLLPPENPTADNLNGYTWSQIQALAQAKLSPEDYKNKYGIEPGSTKTANGKTYVLVDLGLDNGDYNGFAFMYKAQMGQFNPSGSNQGGYGAYALNEVNSLYTSLDSDLQTVIKPVYINYNEGGAKYSESSYHTTNSSVYLFLPSYKEVGFTERLNSNTEPCFEGYNAEGNRFDYFLEETDPESQNLRKSMASTGWWLRTAFSGNNNIASMISEPGNLDGTSTNKNLLYVPVFIVG